MKRNWKIIGDFSKPLFRWMFITLFLLVFEIGMSDIWQQIELIYINITAIIRNKLICKRKKSIKINIWNGNGGKVSAISTIFPPFLSISFATTALYPYKIKYFKFLPEICCTLANFTLFHFISFYYATVTPI